MCTFSVDLGVKQVWGGTGAFVWNVGEIFRCKY